MLRATFAAARDARFRESVLAAIALTRQQEATEWLLGLIAHGERHAAAAHWALCASAPSAATLDCLRELGQPCT